MTHHAMLYHQGQGAAVVCDLCHHRCRIAPGERGICGVRRNDNGRLSALTYNRCIAMHADPIEKKPLFHFLPGTLAFSMAAAGCNFHCNFCQNYRISQADRSSETLPGNRVAPETIVRAAAHSGCQSIAYTYTEPTVFFEYAYDTAVLACEAGIANVFVSNGYMTPEAVDVIAPFLDAINVDLKSFDPRVYRQVIGGRLEKVLETIRYLHGKGIWMEITSLLIPEMNTDPDQVRAMARFIAGISPDIPWHISRFFPNYKAQDIPPTPIHAILKAAEIGREEGLRHIYCGNMHDEDHEATHCPHCRTLLIARSGYFVTDLRIPPTGQCPNCDTACPGVWDAERIPRRFARPEAKSP